MAKFKTQREADEAAKSLLKQATEQKQFMVAVAWVHGDRLECREVHWAFPDGDRLVLADLVCPPDLLTRIRTRPAVPATGNSRKRKRGKP